MRSTFQILRGPLSRNLCLLLATGALACPSAGGGSSGSGGAGHTGGSSGTGGTSASTGGTTGTGGALGSGGSATSTGGSATATGGAGTGGTGGGASGSGGRAATGGSSGTGGGAATGGATTGGAGGGATGGAGGATAGVAVLTNRYDTVRSGANLAEKTLTTANVGGGKFGLLFTRMVDGHIYAQPLYMSGLMIGGAMHNVVFVATEANTVFAYDADNAASTTPLWSKTLGTPMRTYPGIENQPVVSPATVSCRDMYPQTGITSTPVIDPATGRLYVVSKNFESNVYSQKLHALDVLTGQEVLPAVSIGGSVTGTAADGNGTMVTFDPARHLNRPGLLLLGGNIYIAFSSHCDDEPYHGWVFAHAADTLAQKGIYCTTPNGGTSMNGSANAGLGGIWQSGMGLVGDGSDVYFAAGNGAFDTANKGAQLGISVGRIQLTTSGLKVMDWFTPSNAKTMNDQDLDYTTAPVLLPNPKVIVMGGKDGYLNVLDPTNLGKFSASTNNVIQQLSVGGHSHGGPVYWNGPSGPTLYIWPEKSALRAYRFSGTKITTTAASQFTTDTPTHPGGTLSLSANGATAGSGILWATFTSTRIDTASGHMGDAWHYLVPGVLYAFDANSLATPIWTSTANKARDDLGILAKFNAPTVANGKVYVGTQVAPASDVASTAAGKLQVYGLLP